MIYDLVVFFFSSRRRHTRCALVTGVQTCALPIYAGQVAWMRAWIEALDLRNMILACQDWGSLIGLRLVAEVPERFAGVALSNGGLQVGRASCRERVCQSV